MPESRPFVGIDFGFRAGTSTALYYSSIKNGTFNVCTDTGDLYIDINNQRIATKDIISMSREEDIKNLTNPYQRIYYAENTYNLWRYDFNSRTWKQVAGENVEHAKKANKDENDNVIHETYETKADATAKKTEIDQHFLQIEREIEDITSFEIEIVDSYEDLPPVGDSGVIYFVPRSGADPDTVYDEYIWITKDAYYEKIGVSTADLTDYYTKTEVNTKLNDYYKKNQTYSKTEIDNKLSTKSPTTHTHDDFTFATATQNGLPGFVPAPSSSQYNYILTAHGWDINSGSVQHAESADYATNAGSANYSTKASSANYSTKASSANYSTNAGTANYAINAGNADYATNAGTASNASTAQYAVAAKNAVSAQYASSAGYTETTGYAINSGRADNAYQAEYASGAGTAASASYDINGKYISSYISSVTYSVAAGGKAGSFTFKKGDSTELKFNLGTFTTATASANGKPGLVPAPTTEQRTGYILSSEGWTNSMAGTIAYANNAGTAVQASVDGNGKNIASTYITNLTINTAASGKGATYQFTRGDSSTVNRTLSTFVQANISTDTSVAPSTAGKPGLVPAPATTQTDVNFVLTPKGWTNAASVRYASTANYANSADKATNDSAGSNIRATYFNSVSVATASGKPSTFTFRRPNDSTVSIVETNTTYTNFKYTSATTDASGTTYSGAAAGLVPSPGNNENSYKGLVLTSQGWKNNVGSVAYAAKTAAATMSTYATKDSASNTITETYFNNVSTSTNANGTTITLKRPAGTTAVNISIPGSTYGVVTKNNDGLVPKASSVTGYVFTSNGSSGIWTNNAGSVAYAISATKDAGNREIAKTYFSSVSASTATNKPTTLTFSTPGSQTSTVVAWNTTYGNVSTASAGLVPKPAATNGLVLTCNGTQTTWTSDAGSVAYAIKSASATSATSATKDTGDREIAKTYFSSVSVATATDSHTTLTLKAPGNTTGSTVLIRNDNNKYSEASTAAAGLIKKISTTNGAVYTSNGTQGSWTTNAGSVAYAAKTAAATMSTYATKDSASNTITETYFNNVSVSTASGKPSTFTFSRPSGSPTTIVETNTTYANVSTAAAGLVPKVTTKTGYVLTSNGTQTTWTNNAGSVAYASSANYSTSAGTATYASSAKYPEGVTNRSLSSGVYTISVSSAISGIRITRFNGTQYDIEPGLLDCGYLA